MIFLFQLTRISQTSVTPLSRGSSTQGRPCSADLVTDKRRKLDEAVVRRAQSMSPARTYKMTNESSSRASAIPHSQTSSKTPRSTRTTQISKTENPKVQTRTSKSKQHSPRSSRSMSKSKVAQHHRSSKQKEERDSLNEAECEDSSSGNDEAYKSRERPTSVYFNPVPQDLTSSPLPVDPSKTESGKTSKASSVQNRPRTQHSLSKVEMLQQKLLNKDKDVRPKTTEKGQKIANRIERSNSMTQRSKQWSEPPQQTVTTATAATTNSSVSRSNSLPKEYTNSVRYRFKYEKAVETSKEGGMGGKSKSIDNFRDMHLGKTNVSSLKPETIERAHYRGNINIPNTRSADNDASVQKGIDLSSSTFPRTKVRLAQKHVIDSLADTVSKVIDDRDTHKSSCSATNSQTETIKDSVVAENAAKSPTRPRSMSSSVDILLDRSKRRTSSESSDTHIRKTSRSSSMPSSPSAIRRSAISPMTIRKYTLLDSTELIKSSSRKSSLTSLVENPISTSNEKTNLHLGGDSFQKQEPNAAGQNHISRSIRKVVNTDEKEDSGFYEMSPTSLRRPIHPHDLSPISDGRTSPDGKSSSEKETPSTKKHRRRSADSSIQRPLVHPGGDYTANSASSNRMNSNTLSSKDIFKPVSVKKLTISSFEEIVLPKRDVIDVYKEDISNEFNVPLKSPLSITLTNDDLGKRSKETDIKSIKPQDADSGSKSGESVARKNQNGNSNPLSSGNYSQNILPSTDNITSSSNNVFFRSDEGNTTADRGSMSNRAPSVPQEGDHQQQPQSSQNLPPQSSHSHDVHPTLFKPDIPNRKQLCGTISNVNQSAGLEDLDRKESQPTSSLWSPTSKDSALQHQQLISKQDVDSDGGLICLQRLGGVDGHYENKPDEDYYRKNSIAVDQHLETSKQPFTSVKQHGIAFREYCPTPKNIGGDGLDGVDALSDGSKVESSNDLVQQQKVHRSVNVGDKGFEENEIKNIRYSDKNVVTNHREVDIADFLDPFEIGVRTALACRTRRSSVQKGARGNTSDAISDASLDSNVLDSNRDEYVIDKQLNETFVRNQHRRGSYQLQRTLPPKKIARSKSEGNLPRIPEDEEMTGSIKKEERARRGSYSRIRKQSTIDKPLWEEVDSAGGRLNLC